MSVREYCLEARLLVNGQPRIAPGTCQAGEGLEDQEHMLTICKLAQQAVG